MLYWRSSGAMSGASCPAGDAKISCRGARKAGASDKCLSSVASVSAGALFGRSRLCCDELFDDSCAASNCEC